MSPTNGLPERRRRNAAEWAAAAEAVVCLGLMRVALGRRPFRRIANRMGLVQTGTAPAAGTSNAEETARIGWAVRAAAARAPWNNACLVQALAGMMMLRRRRISGTLFLGVDKNAEGPDPISAHAWLACGEFVLIGESGRGRFKTISGFSTSFAQSGPSRSGEKDGSSFCLACGLCCLGVLHARAKIDPNEIAHVTSLGLIPDEIDGSLGFRLPCPHHRNGRCSIYGPSRPRVCGAYQCNVLKGFRAGTIIRESGLRIVQRAEELHAEVVAHLPKGCSFDDLSKAMARDWDAEGGPFDTLEKRKDQTDLFLAWASLKMFVTKHFGDLKSLE